MSSFEENAEVLRELASKGLDLGPARLVDFSHVFPDRASAEAFAREAEREGFATAMEEVVEWDVTASKAMVPTCKNITEAELNLDVHACRYGGRADGWGFLSV